MIAAIMVYKILDVFFIALHTALIFFNLFGWMHSKTKKLNLIALMLTGASWFILGIWKGIGYCPLTEWHYQVLHELGQYALPPSYIAYLVERFTGWLPPATLTDVVTVSAYVLALIGSIYVNASTRSRS